MKAALLILFVVPLSLFSQEIPKGANTIEVRGVSFKEVAKALLEGGYTFEKVDSNFQSIETGFKQSKKNKKMEMSLYVRIKDSAAIITGKTFDSGVVGSNFLGTQISKEEATFDIEYTNGNFMKVFNEMKVFALSFNKPVQYLKL